MSYGYFKDNGATYVIKTAFTPLAWNNYLFNDHYLLNLSQRMQGVGETLSDVFIRQPVIGEERKFYVKKDGNVAELLRENGSFYECEQRLYESVVNEKFSDFETSIRAFVPVEGTYEVWTVTLKNTSDKENTFSLYSYVPFEKGTVMAQTTDFDKDNNYAYKTGFPFYTFYEDYEKSKAKITYMYMYSDVKVDAYECNVSRFFGAEDHAIIPKTIKEDKLPCKMAQNEMGCGALQHDITLGAGESKTINFIIGVEKNREDIKTDVDIDAEYKKVKELWADRASSFSIETPDTELNYIMNYWIKKQTTFLGKLNRASTYCPIRNQLQDAMGYSFVDPDDAFRVILNVIKNQKYNGYIKQWVMTDGSAPQKLCLIKHSDAAIWLILCFVEIINKTGKPENFDMMLPYADNDTEEPLYVHLQKAALDMANTVGEHGLCLMLDGDWTDPLNGPGRLGKGESTWNTLCLIYSIRRLNEYKYSEELAKIADKLDAAVNEHCWDGEWYYAGIDDFGRPYGSHKDEEAKQFLNAQTWAVFSGVAKGERLETIMNSMEKLHIDFGYRLFAPEFTKYNEVWGRISVKHPGTTENGAVYCHANMFKALADCHIGDGNKAWRTVLDILPHNPQNPTEQNKQLPTFIPNYYFTLEGDNYGRTSNNYGTGTVAWLVWVVLEHMTGIMATVDGIKTVKPCMPDEWKSIKLTRRFQGKTYDYIVENN